MKRSPTPKSQVRVELADILQRKDKLIGWNVEHVSGEYGGDSKEEWQIWRGTLSEICILEYEAGLLVSLKLKPAGQLIEIRRDGSSAERWDSSCEFEFDPFQFPAYEWSDGSISFQAGASGLDQVYVISPPRRQLG